MFFSFLVLGTIGTEIGGKSPTKKVVSVNVSHYQWKNTFKMYWIHFKCFFPNVNFAANKGKKLKRIFLHKKIINGFPAMVYVPQVTQIFDSPLFPLDLGRWIHRYVFPLFNIITIHTHLFYFLDHNWLLQVKKFQFCACNAQPNWDNRKVAHATSVHFNVK